MPPYFEMSKAFCWIILFTGSAIATCAAESKETVTQQFRIETPVARTEATTEARTRHSDSKEKCEVAPDGEVFDLATVRTAVKSHDDDSERHCFVKATEFKEVIPGTGISMPAKICLHAHVRSVPGGIFDKNKRGHLVCEAHGRRTSAAAFHKTKKPARGRKVPPGAVRKVVLTMPGVPVDFSIDPNGKALVVLSVPLKTIEAQNKDVKFTDFAMGERDLSVAVRFGGSKGTVKCRVTVRFALPASTLSKLAIQDRDSNAECQSGFIGDQLFGLGATLEHLAQVAFSFGFSGYSGIDAIKKFASEDPELAAFLDTALVQGEYCKVRDIESLCFRVAWADESAFRHYFTAITAKVPLSKGRINLTSAKRKRALLRTEAVAHRQYTHNEIKYPAGQRADGSVEDGDMALFGGLLCSVGERVGCDLLKNSFDKGRFWRSPRLVGQHDGKHATFSSDQMRGVFSYVIATRDKARLTEFLKFVVSNPTAVPNEDSALIRGYSSCEDRAPTFTCLVGGFDWHLFKKLAIRWGLKSALPKDLAAIEARYGYTHDQLIWESMFVPTGYRLHLVGLEVYLLRKLGDRDPRILRAARILAGRQPNNPFFAYLYLGPDRHVQQQLDKKCTYEGRTDFSDWAWQRSEHQEKWKNSMVWDCVFMYDLLLSPRR